MHPRARELIDTLGLAPHPEGGFYREIHRSPARVLPQDGRPARSALTTIHFLLPAGTFSRWHRVRSDEVWHWYEGEPLELLVAPPDATRVERWRMGPVAAEQRPSFTVPADWWQAARPLGTFAFVGCTVGPGFEFADFSFLRDDRASEALYRVAPDLGGLL